jgi:hypothetical protein
MILINSLNSHFTYLNSHFTYLIIPRQSFPFDIEFYSSLDVYHPGIIWVVS